jgi:hypothetical protein
MTAAASLQREVEAFFESYRAAFERQDPALIADHYAYPAHVTSDVGRIVLVPAASREDWIRRLGDLLGMYSKIGFASAKLLEVVATELSPRLAQGRVQWALSDRAGERLYTFDTLYILGRFENELKITSAVSANEIERYRACAVRLGF